MPSETANLRAIRACEYQLSALPVLTYLKAGCAPVLEIYHSRLRLTLNSQSLATHKGLHREGTRG
ncbi:hypothetical protein EQG66_02070 [Sphingobium fluviale]|uniref:Uncharacterized protein n=1 Tax=Sphingobium fluviale TaxID=2506423 RepID=A0A4Q1KNI1_9SPHN|nr:hypothetical protein EQG66_02070 [Sphingobium fluviale]